MRKIFIVLMIVGTIILFGKKVEAETFFEGDFINGEYINKVKGNKTYYMTLQYIKDSQGRIVYCLEPFVDFKTGQSYVEYTSDLTSYNKLTSAQKRKIELIVYYGYGFNNRKEDKWYVVTQYLIWKTVDGNADIYFTNKLNGTRINKYENEINEIMNDVMEHEVVPDFIKEYNVNYGDTLIINNIGDNYEITNNAYDSHISGEDLVVESLLESGKIGFKKKSNYYDNNVIIYDSTSSQDLIRPGNVKNPEYLVDINVSKGNITLDIRDDDTVYTIESTFKNTCYEIINGTKFVDKVCTNDKPLIYKTVDLPYGEYKVIQTSVGLGYKKDENVYNIIVDKSNEQPTIILNNKLIRNDIEILKYACKDDVCAFEKGARFEIRDSKDNLVDEIKTKENGSATYTLGYGKYKIIQVSGISGYTIAEAYSERIVDETSLHKKELYNYYIEEVVTTPVEEFEKTDEVILPPKTNVDLNLGFVILLSGLFAILKRIFY